MNIALVDDEQIYISTLSNHISDVLSEMGVEDCTIDTFTDPDIFFFHWEADKYDIVILDIYMANINGIDVAKKIREEDKDCVLAFCTSSNEFAMQSYEVDAKYYLHKPISKEKVVSMLGRMNVNKLEQNRPIRLADGFRFQARHLIYTEYQNHSVTFYMGADHKHTIYMSHGDAEKLLSGHKVFFTANKGCIVNLSHVKKIADGTFVMSDNSIVPISRRRLKEANEAWTAYRFEKLDAEVD